VEIRLSAERATADEARAVDAVLGAPDRPDGRTSRRGLVDPERRSLALPALHALQSRAGWISPGGLNYVADRLSIPPADLYGVATFYAMFATKPRGASVIHVCDDAVCRTNGAKELCGAMRARFGPPIEDGGSGWTSSPCLGLCERAPAALAQRSGPGAVDEVTAPATLASISELAAGGSPQPPLVAAYAPFGARLLRRVLTEGFDPGSLDSYRAHGGYEALRRALDLGPALTVREVKDAKLLGRGGAAFPTGVKWEGVAQQAARPKFVVCNADESETGTFKDRVILENDPFAVVEALTIAGFATGAERGYLYVRGEYPKALERLSTAIERARSRGFLGPAVMGSRVSFDIELRRGAGAYICGEETALFNAIEGRRGEPRSKPPFPVTHGLFGRPTAINNVETLVNVLEILRGGAEAYAATGSAASTGPRLFCVSGHVARPGTYEVPHGTTLRALLEAAGGVRGTLRAILLGGAAGGFVGSKPEDLDMPLSFEGARERGATLGSGVVAVFDDTVDLVDLLRRIARFFRDESCGQCVPCRVGTVRQEEALARLAAGKPLGSRADELARLGEIAAVMKDASICGLGHTAASAVQSAVARFGLGDAR
jgi:NADH-quinone oxidoreductase subunit F